jgi:hypothetical protein
MPPVDRNRKLPEMSNKTDDSDTPYMGADVRHALYMEESCID